ncbi:MAG: phosphoenolpyruvate--protein phosphotransferase [Actinomycetota bacterium]
MVGIVVVSHSFELARGVVELAREMGGDEVHIEASGGLDEPEHPLGTDAALVMEAIERASSGDGVLVLMDLGSAVLSAEMALEMRGDGRERVLLSPAPLVEGAVAAAAAARQGATLEEVAAEASRGAGMKAAHLGGEDGGEATEEGAGALDDVEDAVETRLRVDNPMGLHARPAARFVATAARFEADVTVTNASSGRGPAPARSLSGIATLGVRRGHEIVVRARGRDAQDALAALRHLAEAGFGDERVEASAPPPEDEPSVEPVRRGDVLRGVAASPGIAVGEAHVWRRRPVEVPDEAADDPDAEWAALERAIEAARADIRATRDSVDERLGGDEAAIFYAQLLLLEDEALLEPARRAVFGAEVSGARAWKDATDATARAYGALDDAYQAGRAADVEDVAQRVLANLVGDSAEAVGVERDGILLAEELAPTDAAHLDPANVLAIVTARGGPTSHSAILARAAGIPAVVGAGAAVLAIDEGATLAVDGDSGVVVVAPSKETLADYERRRDERAAEQRIARAAARSPAATRDEVRIEVMANAASQRDAKGAVAAGADGIGLLRTEFLFMDRDEMPEEEEQLAAYSSVATALQGRPVIVRTLDAGADKPLDYVAQGAEDNPFLGVRGLRLGLARRDLLGPQLRAALRVANEHPVKIMFPMVTLLDEWRRAVELVDGALEELRAAGIDAARPEIGVMVEVPSVALVAEHFAAEVDFFSVGTNDLSQYTMAAERGNERVAALADALHPAVLRLIAMTCAAARRHGKWVGVCGELAGDIAATAILVGLGVRELSMGPPAIAEVKQAVRGIDARSARALAGAALDLRSAAEVRALVAERSR